MRWRRSLPPEIKYSGDEGDAEVARPDVIGRHASSEWIPPIRDPLCECLSPTAALGRKLYGWIIRGAAQKSRSRPRRTSQLSILLVRLDRRLCGLVGFLQLSRFRFASTHGAW